MEKVGRHDRFFDLGGHSLLMVSMVERMRREGLQTEIRQVFQSRSLAELASSCRGCDDEIWRAPPNLIPKGCERVTPEMLPLIELTQEEIDRIVAKVPGGTANVQDIYPLAPLQEGVLFHHRFHQDNDPYVLWVIMSFDSKQQLMAYTSAIEHVTMSCAPQYCGKGCHKQPRSYGVTRSWTHVRSRSREKGRRWNCCERICRLLHCRWTQERRR